jgi:hypothetical protein
MEQTVYDPWAAASDPQVREGTGRWFGQVYIDVWACVLKKGAGKVPFDPTQHNVNDRLTAIKMEVIPLAEHNVGFTLMREMIAEFGGWPKVTLPSIKALGVDLRTVDKAWVSVELKPTGRKYTSKEGETKDETTFAVLAVFKDQNACREAFEIFNAGDHTATAPDNGKEKETASQFLRPIWNACNGNQDMMAQMLAGNPLTSKYFTINSPEVQSVMR